MILQTATSCPPRVQQLAMALAVCRFAQIERTAMKLLGILVIGCGLLAGCSTPQQRMADCEAQGISRDTCYLSEQNRRNALLGAAERQALENAQRQNHHRR